jgi:hypothetical protein
MTTNLFASACCAITLTSCALDPSDLDAPAESTQTSEVAIDPYDPKDPPQPVVVPPEGPNVVRISSSDLEIAMRAYLGGQMINIDTTGTSPVRFGTPYTTCTDVNQPAREAEQDACFESFSGSALTICLQQALADYPVQTECHTTASSYHSYLDFSSRLEQENVKDVMLDVEPIYVEGWTSHHRVDLNYLRSDLTKQITAGFTTNKTASLSFPLTSNSPTLIVDDGPDVQMSNMRVLLRFTNIEPGPAYACAEGGIAPNCVGGASKLVSARVKHLTPRPTFVFDRNINYLPDWLVDQLFDVDAEIRSAAEGQLQTALLTPAASVAIDKAITALAIYRVRNTTHPQIVGFKRIKNTWYVSGQLVIEYDWY